MATVTGFTAERMLNIENSTVVDGEVQGDNLILLTRAGTPIDAGNVRGPKGDTGAIGPGVLHAGMISMYGGNTAPAGYLLCQGQNVSRVTYSALFAAIGTNYGNGDGFETFGVPNLQQRFPVGKGTEPWADNLNDTGGSKDAAVVQHNHSIGHTHNTSNHYHGFDHGHTASSDVEGGHTHSTPDHTHYPLWNGASGGVGTGFAFRSVVPGGGGGYEIINGGPDVVLDWTMTPGTTNSGRGTTGQGSIHNHPITVTGLTGSSTTPAGKETLTHTGNTPDIAGAPPVVGNEKNLPPYVVVNFIIKT